MSTQKQPVKSEEAEKQHQLIGVKDTDNPAEFTRNSHPDAQWFGNAGLGLFIHWGISTVCEKVDISWGMIYDTPYDAHLENVNKLTPNDYFKQADSFNPDSYDPDKWLKAAAAAGFKYAILTTRHHDGYALWPSAAGDFSTRTHMGGRDLVKPFVDACRNNGLKVGLYYSPPDWRYNGKYMSFHYASEQIGRFPGRTHFDRDHKVIESVPEKPEGFHEGYLKYIRAQVEELLTRYGKIDVLFFDGGPDAIPFSRLRELQPSMVVNPRMHGYGDYTTPECRMPDTKPEPWWELCELWNEGSWGYDKRAEKYKPTAWMLTRFSQVRGWGGNYLINVAPKSNGILPEDYYVKMEELKCWMERCGESVTGTEAGNYPEDCNVPYTRKGNTVYCFLPPDFKEPISLQWDMIPKNAALLGRGNPVDAVTRKGAITVAVDSELRSGFFDVVKIEF